MNRNSVALRGASIVDMDLIIEKQMAELGLGLDFGKLNINDVAARSVSDGLDGRGLAAARLAVKHEAQCIGNALLLIPVATRQKELDMLFDLFTLLKKHVVEGAGSVKLVLGINEMGCWQGVLNALARLAIGHHVKKEQGGSQLIRHLAFIVQVTPINKSLEKLDFVVIAKKLELNGIYLTIIMF